LERLSTAAASSRYLKIERPGFQVIAVVRLPVMYHHEELQSKWHMIEIVARRQMAKQQGYS